MPYVDPPTSEIFAANVGAIEKIVAGHERTIHAQRAELDRRAKMLRGCLAAFRNLRERAAEDVDSIAMALGKAP